MQTHDLIVMLARGAGPAPRAAVARRVIPATALGLLASTALAIAVFGPIPPAMLATPAPWIKLGYVGTMAVAALWLVAALSRPVARLGGPRALLAAVAVGMAVLAAAAWVQMPTQARMAALLGVSWMACPWNVLALSLPALALALWAMRGLAPTQARGAGFAAGVLAGSVGAVGYSLSCPEVSVVFVALWYSLGIVLTGAVGAVLGPRVLRW